MLTIRIVNKLMFPLCSLTELEMESQFLWNRQPSITHSRLCRFYVLDPKIDEDRIVKQRPLQIHCSSTFVVDITQLSHPDDIKKDMYGKWLYKGSHTDVFRCSFDDDNKVIVEKAGPAASGSNVYYLRRLHSVHPSNKALRRIVAIIFGEYAI